MRKIALLLALPTAWIACFSNDNGSPDAAAPDFDSAGGVDASFDASQIPDVGTTFADSAPDALPPDVVVDSPPPVLTVVVGGANGFEKNVSIVWSDATGAVLGTSTTDVHGAATTEMANVAMATAVLGTTAYPSPYTVMGAALGQTIVVADVLSFQQNFQQANAIVTSLPTMPALIDGGFLNTHVTAGSGCESVPDGPPPIDVPLYSSCAGLAAMGASFGATVSILDEADDSTGLPLGYAYTNGLSLSGLDAGNLDVALPSTWQTTFGLQTLQVADSDAGASPSLAYSEVADGALFPLSTFGVTPGDAAVSVIDDFYTHPGFAQTVQAEAVYPPPGESVGGTVLATFAPAPTGNQTITIDPTPLASAPTFESSGVDFTAPARPVVSWTLGTGSSLATSTAVVAVMSWYGQVDGGGVQSGTWTVVSPGTTSTSLTLPALPASLAAYAPTDGASENSVTLMAVSGETAFTSYGSFLLAASALQVESNLCYLASPALPAMSAFGALGTVMITIYSDGLAC